MPPLFAQFWVFVLLGPPLGCVLMLGPKRVALLIAASIFAPLVVYYLALVAYCFGAVPAIVTGLAWSFSRRLRVEARIGLTTFIGGVVSWPVAGLVAGLPVIVGNWVWVAGSVATLVCSVLAARMADRAATRSLVEGAGFEPA